MILKITSIYSYNSGAMSVIVTTSSRLRNPFRSSHSTFLMFNTKSSGGGISKLKQDLGISNELDLLCPHKAYYL